MRFKITCFLYSVAMIMFIMTPNLSSETKSSVVSAISGQMRIVRQGVIQNDKVNLREKPTIESAIVKQYNKGDTVIILGSRKTNDKKYENWFAVNDEANTQGYVFSGYCTSPEGLDVIYDINRYSVEFNNTTKQLLISDLNRKVILCNDKIDNIECSMIKKNIIDHYLFISIEVNTSTSSPFIGIYDINSQLWCIKLQHLDNPSILLLLPYNRNYLCIDSGTDASERGLIVVDLNKNKIVHNSNYIPYAPIYWNQNSLIYFSSSCNETDVYPPFIDLTTNKKISKKIIMKDAIEKSFKSDE